MRFLFLFMLLLLLANVSHAQNTVKTATARDLTLLNVLIERASKIAELDGEDLAALRKRYSDEYPDVKTQKEKYEASLQRVSALQARKQGLLSKPQTQPMPTTDTALLRQIVIQNERVLDLLERLVWTTPPPY